VAVGARAAGLALWGAVIGAFMGFNTATYLDETPYLAMVGASAGCFGGGLLGLMWKSSASAVALRACGLGTLLVGVLSTWALSTQICPAIRFPKDCVCELNPRWLALFALDAVWVAALCFIQAAQSNRARRSIVPVQRDPITAVPGASAKPSQERLDYSRLANRWVVASVLASVGVALIWFGTQIVDQSQTEPGGKLFLASWLESQLWINPWLVSLGLVGLTAAIVVLVLRGRTSSQAT